MIKATPTKEPAVVVIEGEDISLETNDLELAITTLTSLIKKEKK